MEYLNLEIFVSVTLAILAAKGIVLAAGATRRALFGTPYEAGSSGSGGSSTDAGAKVGGMSALQPKGACAAVMSAGPSYKR